MKVTTAKILSVTAIYVATVLVAVFAPEGTGIACVAAIVASVVILEL